jgi:hypothetical protein
MIMKKSLMLGAVMMISTIVFAQHKPGKSHDGEGQAEKMKTELSLSDAQYTSIKSINKKYKDKHNALEKDSTLTGEFRSGQMKNLKKEREKEVYAVLTPEQYAQWKAHKKEESDAKKAQKEEAKAAKDAKMKSDLGLSDEQFTKLDAINDEYKEKRKALEKETDKTERKKLAVEHEAKVKTILTAEQFEKWKVYKAEVKEEKKEKKESKKKT